ncbi:YhcB family protein [Planktothrix agardhii]|uniref:YhcB family protein n=1 Tax=Planktothrix agardhii TaxID=1160 RepID=UPI001D0A2E0E|nr:YhcB family protein [Planktothrix agardhii]MCB8760298.1 YhcB family protein [Planktothrix agardhii 1813]
MELYVQSRGVSKEYCWLGKNPTKSSNLPDNFKRMLEMVDGDYFSLVIYRANGQLSLLVTALKSQNRIDNRTRKIKNSVLWVGDNSDEETLRAISIQALNGKLSAKIDQAVFSKNNTQGFEVDFEELEPKKLDLPSVENNRADSSKKIGKLSALKDSLIDELKKYCLPIQEGMLVVVVSSTVSQSSLEREKVWRGLSDVISGDEWVDLSVKGDQGDNFRGQPSDSNRDPNTSSQPEKGKSGTPYTPSSGLPTPFSASSRSDKRNPEDSPLKKWIPIIVAFVIGLLIGIVGHYLYYSNIPNMQKQQIEQNEKTIGDQEDKIADQDKRINDQKDIIVNKEKTIKQKDKLIEDIFNYAKEFTDKGLPLIERINGVQK